MIKNKPDLRFALKPNCLLTRRPLIWITPPRSLFYYKKPWADIPLLLFEHGYKVNLLQLPFQNINLKKQVLNQKITKLKYSHIFVDSVTYMILKEDLLQLASSTITVIGKNDDGVFHFEPLNTCFSLSYFLHQKWCHFLNYQTPLQSETFISCSESTWHKLLEHCVYLAELDFELPV